MSTNDILKVTILCFQVIFLFTAQSGEIYSERGARCSAGL